MNESAINILESKTPTMTKTPISINDTLLYYVDNNEQLITYLGAFTIKEDAIEIKNRLNNCVDSPKESYELGKVTLILE